MMNREAIEAQMDALMGEATPKKSPKMKAPVASTSKTMMAALVVGGAILGALLMGIFQRTPVQPSAVSDLVETVEDPEEISKGSTVFIYMGLGRFRK